MKAIEKARIQAAFGSDTRFSHRGEDGIRTHVPRRTNGFQDRLVMTAPTPLQCSKQSIHESREICQSLENLHTQFIARISKTHYN